MLDRTHWQSLCVVFTALRRADWAAGILIAWLGIFAGTAYASFTALTGATQVAVGSQHSCAVVNGGVQCWGNNSNGQLGNGATSDSTTPIQAIVAGSSVTTGNSYTCTVSASNSAGTSPASSPSNSVIVQ